MPWSTILDRPKGRETYGQVVNVNWIDSILTKKPVPCLATPEENDAKYGHDAVDIVRDWDDSEDGYLTLRFRALWENVKAHSINLIANVNPGESLRGSFATIQMAILR